MTSQPTPGEVLNGESLVLVDADVEFRIFQDDELCSGSTGRSDAEHYAAMYGQDGPVERQTSINLSFSGFLSDEAIEAVKARVSRPQPSGGQDGGGEGGVGWLWHSRGGTLKLTTWHPDTQAETAARLYTHPAPAKATGWQDRCKEWLLACFGPETLTDVPHRTARFLEEALELAQASGFSAERAHEVVDYVYGRDAGDVNQEVGGVMMTLAAHCIATGHDMTAEGERELARVWTKVDAIRAKEAAKPSFAALSTNEVG